MVWPDSNAHPDFGDHKFSLKKGVNSILVNVFIVTLFCPFKITCFLYFSNIFPFNLLVKRNPVDVIRRHGASTPILQTNQHSVG